MLRWCLLAAAVTWGGCFSPDYSGGKLQCDPAHSCPPGYTCGCDGRCNKPGPGPTCGVADMAAPPDLTPAVTSYPPRAIWLSSGGGTSVSNGNSLSLSIGGTPIAGQSKTSVTSTVINYGYFSTGSIQ